MSETVITIEKLAKRYVIRHQLARREGLRHVLEESIRAPVRWLRSRRELVSREREEFWALRDVNFEVQEGEALGVVGRNGAGKSTLLKVLSRITEPTQGRIRLRGRVASLLEVGTGFHAELTGRENIFLNGAVLGMRRAETRRKFDEIVAFAAVEKFLDTPVKRYSSGMYVRLAFAVAAHLEPEILLVDEVLAVGDAAFQSKCLTKMGEVARGGRTVLFVSHNMAAVSSLCTRAVLIDQGRVVRTGPPPEVVDAYLARQATLGSVPLADRKDRTGEGRVVFTSAAILNDRLCEIDRATSGQDIVIALDYELQGSESCENATVQIKFAGVLGQPLFACLSRVTQRESLRLTRGGRILCRIPRLPLVAGRYTFTLWCTVGDVLEDLVREAGTLTVVEGDYFGTGKLPANQTGDFLVMNSWSVEKKP
jgi:lipopolysaccharide transport system ATP-binding protein